MACLTKAPAAEARGGGGKPEAGVGAGAECLTARKATSIDSSGAGATTVVHRYYIDVRGLSPSGVHKGHVSLPLLSTLPQELQQSIQKYFRPQDRLMSLSSALLKYYFIHKQARLPWNQVQISRTERPHGRPYWSPPAEWRLRHEGGLEFNVTHQNGLIGLVGCTTPTVQDPRIIQPTTTATTATTATTTAESTKQPLQIRLGVDVSCVEEVGRGPKDITTQAKLDEWIDIFGEMFSDKCRDEIRSAPPPNTLTGVSRPSITATIQSRLRRFYALWALKEAYIKMVGEGLLASWLTKLEFENVQVPLPAKAEDWAAHAEAAADAGHPGHPADDPDEEAMKWTPPTQAARDIRAVLDGKQADGVQLSLVAYEDIFIFATAMRGVVEQTGAGGNGNGNSLLWKRLDFDTDIRPCAEGRCGCVEGGQWYNYK